MPSLLLIRPSTAANIPMENEVFKEEKVDDPDAKHQAETAALVADAIVLRSGESSHQDFVRSQSFKLEAPIVLAAVS